jgi:aspartyl protease family protein
LTGVSTFSVHAEIANPQQPRFRLGVELMVDTGATYSLLPAEVVAQLDLATPWQRIATLASGEGVTLPMGHVLMQLNGEEMPTIFLAGPRGCQGLIGAVTLEEFALAADPVHQRLVPVARIFL